jgi:hypothetical protein
LLDSARKRRYRRESGHSGQEGDFLKQNQLYLLIGALVVIVIVLGGYIYHERTKPEGVQIQFDQNGLKIQKN